MLGLSVDEEIMALAFCVLIQYRDCDGQTDGRTDISALAIPVLAQLAMLPLWQNCLKKSEKATALGGTKQYACVTWVTA